MEFSIQRIITIALVTSTVNGNEFITMSKISQDMENILYIMKSPTVTYCHILCSQESKCHTIGVTKDPTENSLYNCYLLKKRNKVKCFDNQTAATKWKQHIFVDSNEKTIQHERIMVKGNVTKQYRLQLDVKRMKYGDSNFHLIYLRENKILCMPCIIFLGGKHKGLYFESHINGAKHVYNTGVLYPLRRWMTVEVRQIRQCGDYIYSILIDGVEIHSVINCQPENLYNVYGWLNPIPKSNEKIFVRNVRLMVEE